MRAFTVHRGLAAPLDRANVDTDAIIPKQFLKSIKRSGFGPNLFDDWRYLDHGEPGMDNSVRALNPDFVLNKPRYKGASILVARKNFGCGSSREHAPWALEDYGFRCVIAPSFADIFFNNCFKIGLLPLKLSETEVDRIFGDIHSFIGFELVIDVPQQEVRGPNDELIARFDVDTFRKHSMVNGLDEIGLTLKHAEAIRAYEARRFAAEPWLAGGMST